MKRSQTELRRVAGALVARLPELGLAHVADRRSRRGRRWGLQTILSAVLLGIMAGCKSLAEVEELTAKLSVGIRRRLKLPPMKDTTLRDTLVRLHPSDLRAALQRLVKAAERRKALQLVEGLPFHAASMDGKWSAIPYWDHHYAQQKACEEKKHQFFGVVRTINSVLVTSSAKVVLDAMPVPAEACETSIFPHAFDSLMRTYGHLVDLVMYDAGAASIENMAHVVNAGKQFLFCLADKRWRVYQKAEWILGQLPPAHAMAVTEETLSKSDNRTRVRRVYIATSPKGYKSWKDIRTLLRVQSLVVEKGVILSDESRYFASSLEPKAISAEQWLALIRSRWCVENNLHWTLDTAFKEDDRLWIKANPRGTVVVMVLRRIAYDLLALFRAVTQRTDEKRAMPWRQLLDWVYDTLIAATEAQLEGLRQRNSRPVFC